MQRGFENQRPFPGQLTALSGTWQRIRPRILLLEDSQDVARRYDQVIFAFICYFSTAVLGIQDAVAFLDIHRYALTLIIAAAGAYSKDFTLLGLFLSSVRDHKAGCSCSLCRGLLNDDLIF